MDVAGAVRRQDHHRGTRRSERAELGNGHREVREDLQQVGLEFVIGPVDLVDQQDGHGAVVARVRDRPQQRTTHQERLGVERVLELNRSVGAGPGHLRRAKVQQLAGVVPFVHRLGGVNTVVALQA